MPRLLHHISARYLRTARLAPRYSTFVYYLFAESSFSAQVSLFLLSLI